MYMKVILKIKLQMSQNLLNFCQLCANNFNNISKDKKSIKQKPTET